GACCGHFLPFRRVAVVLRTREMQGDDQDGDSVVVYGPHYRGCEYRRLLLARSIEADLPADGQAATRSLAAFLALLGLETAFASAEYHSAATSAASPLQLARMEAQRQAAAAWCSGSTLSFQGEERSLPWLINFAVDCDDAELLQALLHFFLSFYGCAAELRSPLLPPVQWPEEESGVVRLWHYSALRKDWRLREGSVFRLGGFADGSHRRSAAEAEVEWCFEIPGGKQVPLLYLDPELTGDGVPRFVLQPYTLVVVRQLELGSEGPRTVWLGFPGELGQTWEAPIGP
ncbi:unnamed protein product, partial [Effrenium voratum]